MKKKLYLLIFIIVILFIFWFFFFKKNSNFSLNDDYVTLSWVLENDGLSFQNYYNIVDWNEKINSFETMFNSFKSIKTQDDFEKFQKEFSKDFLFWFLIKMWDKNNWNIFWSYYFEELYKSGDKEFLESIKDFWATKEEKKKEFLSLLLNMFEEFPKIKELSNDDLSIDLKVYFNDLSLEKALDNCKKISEISSTYSDINSCKDKIYNYKATKENWYCDKITDNYKKTLCEDFLKFEENLKK